MQTISLLLRTTHRQQCEGQLDALQQVKPLVELVQLAVSATVHDCHSQRGGNGHGASNGNTHPWGHLGRDMARQGDAGRERDVCRYVWKNTGGCLRHGGKYGGMTWYTFSYHINLQ